MKLFLFAVGLVIVLLIASTNAPPSNIPLCSEVLDDTTVAYYTYEWSIPTEPGDYVYSAHWSDADYDFEICSVHVEEVK